MKKLLCVITSVGLLAGCVTNKESQIMVGDGSNLSMACSYQYEEVSSIRIGCPIDASKMTKVSSINGVEVYSAKIPDSFFDTVKIKAINGNVEGVSFNRSYRDALNDDMNKEMKSLREALQARWGKDTPINLNGRTKVNSYSFRKPKSKVLYHVMATQMTSGLTGVIGVDYTSKKLHDYEKGISDKENAQRVGSFKGL